MSLQQTVPLLYVSNMASSLQFYRDRIGFDIKEQWEHNGHLEWCWLQLGGAALMLQQTESQDEVREAGQGVIFYFMCDDVNEFHQQLTSREAHASPLETTFYQMKQTHLVDPDGYKLCFQTAE